MDNKQQATWLAGLLHGWGIKEIWAKVAAGAIVGALAALYAATSASCTAWRTWEELSPQQRQALDLADRDYHIWRGDAEPPAVVTDGK